MKQKQHTHLIYIILLLLVVVPTTIFAHSDLVNATPKPGQTVPTDLPEIRLIFSEAVTEQSTIILFDEDFKLISLNTFSDPTNPNAIYAPINKTLVDGNYSVQWTAVSPDGHKITGSYKFKVDAFRSWKYYPEIFIFLGAFLLFAMLRNVWKWENRFMIRKEWPWKTKGSSGVPKKPSKK